MPYERRPSNAMRSMSTRPKSTQMIPTLDHHKRKNSSPRIALIRLPLRYHDFPVSHVNLPGIAPLPWTATVTKRLSPGRSTLKQNRTDAATGVANTSSTKALTNPAWRSRGESRAVPSCLGLPGINKAPIAQDLAVCCIVDMTRLSSRSRIL